MNYAQIAAAVYQRCNHFDPYLPKLDAALARAWGALFEKHRLSQDDLLAAVDAVYDHHGAGYRPLPADIITAARALRQDRAMRQPLEHGPLELDPAPDEPGEGYLAALLAVAKIGRRIGGDTSWPHRNPPPELTPLSVPCPYPPCRSPAGHRCYNSATRRALKGHHPSRIDAAAQGIPEDPSPTPPPTPPEPTCGAVCPICERELATPEEATRGICDQCWPVSNGHNPAQEEGETA